MGKPTYEYPASEGLQLDERKPEPPAIPLPSHYADDKVPLVFYTIEGNKVVSKKEQEIQKRYCGLTPMAFWIVLIVVLLLVVGSAVGAGVGAASLAGKSAHSLSSNRCVEFTHCLRNNTLVAKRYKANG